MELRSLFPALAFLICGVAARDDYRGKPLGKLSQLHHAVSGDVYVVDARTVHIRNFHYDGEGPAAYFYVGSSKNPGNTGFRLRDERGTANPLPRYRGQDITLSLPEGKSLQNLRWLSVWCEEFAVNFGDVRIPKGFDFPRPHKLGALSGIHGVSSDQIVIVDAQTLLIPNFSYDGEAPDAKFWVGQGSRPTPQGIRIPDENGKTDPLRRYDRKTIVLTLPGDMTVYDIGHFGVWCEAFTVDFGHVLIPQGLNVPPSLKMLGVLPQKRSRSLDLPNYTQNTINEESRQQPISRPIFYHDFNARPAQDIKPTTYRPTLLRRPVPQPQPQQQQINTAFDIQPSIAQNEFVIHEETGEFVPPLDIQFSRKQEIRYQPTPAERILHHNPPEPSPISPQQESPFIYNAIPQGNFIPQARPIPQPLIQQNFLAPQLQIQQIQPGLIHQQQYPQEPAVYQQPPPVGSTNHFGKLFNQMNVEANVNHNPQLGAGSFSRFVINRSTDSGFFHSTLDVQDVSRNSRTIGFAGTGHSKQGQVRGLELDRERIWADVSMSKLNCEVLWDDLAFEVRWAVAGDSIVLQLVARLDAGEYMAFGVSGDDQKSQMVGGDVTVAWVDKNTLKGQAKDYFLDAKSQCSGTRGSCPDENISAKTNSVRLLNAALVNGYSIVTYQRSLKAQDENDRSINTNRTQPIIWAIGPLNARTEVSYHSLANRADILFDFGRPPKWNCPTPEAQNVPNPQPEVPKKPAQQSFSETTQQSSKPSRPKTPPATPAPVPKMKPWHIPAIECNEPEDGTFFAQMGPTGGKQGYPAITGHVGWGISWYINGLLIPEINVVRGRTYTFFVEGGIDPEVPARYHPFYITDDPVGGYEYKTPEERAKVQIYAGAEQNSKGEVRPTGVGRLCNWVPDQNHSADDFASFGAYQRTLQLICDKGDPGIVQWTVNQDTPDTVYYQCFTHRYLGWKINVLDECEESAGSDMQPVFVRAPQVQNKILEIEPEAEASIQHETKIRPENQIPSGATHYNKQPIAESSPVTYVPVPQFHFYNEETGEPLDHETIQKMNLERDIERLQAQFYKRPVQPQPQVNPNQDEQFINFFHTPKPTYSVEEQPEDDPPALPSNQFQLTPQTERPSYVPTTKAKPMHYEETTPYDDAFNKEFLKNYHQLQAEAAAKLKKYNQKQHYGKPTRLQYSAPRRPSNSHHALTLQQRPLPPGMFRPPFLPPPNKKNHPKRPITAGSQKIPTYAHINNIPNRPNNYPRPQKPQRHPEPTFPPHIHHPQHLQTPQVNINQVLALQKLISTMKPQDQSSIIPSTPIYVERPYYTEPTPLAINTGFNPNSVKVEGGFKPIINTGIAPSFKAAEERMDDVVDESNVEDNIGVIDLTKQEIKIEDVHIESSNKTQEEPDIFKHLTPVKFEPMFVPSPLDHRVQKPPTKYKKKVVDEKYQTSIKHRNTHLEPYNAQKNKYIKMRPRPTLIRRPLYPNNVMPPFKIPVRGGSPQFRFQQSEEDSIEDTTDFEVIQMSNETAHSENDSAQNILEVIEMQTEGNATEPEGVEIAVLNTDTGEIIENDFQLKNETDDEIAMADETRNVYVAANGSPVTYDGKRVSAIAPPSLPETRRQFDISKMPQFTPFRGELPSFPASIADLPQLTSSKAARSDILPSGHSTKRNRRSPDHVPGHVGDDHDHYDSQHHDHNDESHQHSHNSGNSIYSGLLMVPIMAFVRFL